MGTVCPTLCIEAKRHEPDAQLLVERHQLVTSSGHAKPNHPWIARRGECTGTRNTQFKRRNADACDRRLQRIEAWIANLAKEPQRDVEILGRDPSQRRAWRGARDVPLKPVRRSARGRQYVPGEFRGKKEPHH